MKVLYSQIKELVPDLSISPRKLGEILTIIGFMMDGFEEIEFNNKNDYLIGFEVRQNRPDCLSVIGIVKEAAAYYGLEIKYPQLESLNFGKEDLIIKANVQNAVKRVRALKIDNIENKESPPWLKQYLSFYGINSINLLIDLSNYVMIITGYPSHIIDNDKITGDVSWEINKDFKKIITLDGTNVELNKDELIIRDDKSIIALAGIVGSQYGSVDIGSKSIIIEMAVYDRTIIRKNSRSLRITTEASNRLEKDLDPNGIDYAINLLVSLIQKHCNGKIVSKMFNYYPTKRIPETILFNPEMSSIYAGVEISREDVIKILKNLRFKVTEGKKFLKVTLPSDRMDISLEQDLVEEVIRLHGYNHIPNDILPPLTVVENITPKHINIIERIKDILSILGYDEVLTWSLTKKGYNSIVNYKKEWKELSTQNSVNEDFPELRQSMAIGLLMQFEEYQKKNIEYIRIFEIGKTFGKINENHLEYDTLGILLYSESKALNSLKLTIEILLRQVGINEIHYKDSQRKPKIANPYSCWDILVPREKLGIIYKIDPYKQVNIIKGNVYFAELNINKLTQIITNLSFNPILELTKKIITLDANVELKANEFIDNYIKNIKNKIGENNIWGLRVKDVYKLSDGKVRYTLRVSYKELSNQEAKSIHLSSLNLGNKP